MAGFTHGGAFIVPIRRIGELPTLEQRACEHGSPMSMRGGKLVCGPTCPHRRAKEAKETPDEVVFIQSAVPPPTHNRHPSRR